MEQADEPGTNQREPLDSMLTDAVLAELRNQSQNGCLLCSFDAWESEEWD